MTDLEILYSVAKYIKENNPLEIQVCVDYKNFSNASVVSEDEEYINVKLGNGKQTVKDKVSDLYYLKDKEVAVTLRYNKVPSTFFDIRESKFQRWIEGMEQRKKENIDIYKFNDLGVPEKSNKKVRIQYANIDGIFVLEDDDISKVMFWVIPIRHTN